MNLMKTIGLAAAVALGAIAASGAANAQDTIKIATEGAYPPFNKTTAAGELVGFDVDIAKALCAEMKTECEIVAQDWDGIIPGLVAKKYDAIIASMSITDERKKTVDFTGRYYSNHLRIVAKDGADAKLDGKTVGAQRATVAAKWLEDNHGRTATVKLYDTQTAAYADLTSGRLDALVSDVYPAYDWLQSNEGYAFVGDKIDINDRIGIAVRKGEDDLREKLNTALKAIRENGTYAEINKAYFPFDIY